MSCTESARRVHDWGTYAINTSTYCLRMHSTGRTASQDIVITGSGFGTGTAESSASVYPRTSTDRRGIRCSGTGLYVSDKQLRCTVDLGAGGLPRSALDIVVTTAWHITNVSSASRFTVVGVCACGYYADNDGNACDLCPVNNYNGSRSASCAGALERPHSNRGYKEVVKTDWAKVKPDFISIFGRTQDLSGATRGCISETQPSFWSLAFHRQMLGLETEEIRPLDRCLPYDSRSPTDTAKAVRFMECPTPDACLVNDECGRTSSGWMCSFCRPNHERGYAGSCLSCGGDGQKAIIWALLLGLGLSSPLLAVFFLCAKNWCAKKCSESGIGAAMLTAYAWCSSKKRSRVLDLAQSHDSIVNVIALVAPMPILTLLKLGLTYTQTLGAIPNYTTDSFLRNFGLPSEWPEWSTVNFLADWSVIADLGLSSRIVSCAFGLNMARRILFGVVAPFLLPIVIYFFSRFSYLFVFSQPGWWAATHSGKAPSPSPESSSDKVDDSFSNACTCCQRRVWIKPKWLVKEAGEFSSQAALLALFALIPSCIDALAKTIPCEADDRGGYARGFPEMSCHWREVQRLQLCAMIFAWLYTLVPVVYGCVLWLAAEREKRVASTDSTTRLSYLLELSKNLTQNYDETRPITHGWECLTIVRRALLVGIATELFPLHDATTRVVLTMFVFVVALVAHIVVWPYREPVVNLLETCALVGESASCMIIITRLLASVYAQRVVKDIAQDASLQGLMQDVLVFQVVAVLLNMPFVLSWGLCMLDSSFYDGKLTTSAVAWMGLGRVAGPTSQGPLQMSPTGNGPAPGIPVQSGLPVRSIQSGLHQMASSMALPVAAGTFTPAATVNEATIVSAAPRSVIGRAHSKLGLKISATVVGRLLATKRTPLSHSSTLPEQADPDWSQSNPVFRQSNAGRALPAAGTAVVVINVATAANVDAKDPADSRVTIPVAPLDPPSAPPFISSIPLRSALATAPDRLAEGDDSLATPGVMDAQPPSASADAPAGTATRLLPNENWSREPAAQAVPEGVLPALAWWRTLAHSVAPLAPPVAVVNDHTRHIIRASRGQSSCTIGAHRRALTDLHAVVHEAVGKGSTNNGAAR